MKELKLQGKNKRFVVYAGNKEVGRVHFEKDVDGFVGNNMYMLNDFVDTRVLDTQMDTLPRLKSYLKGYYGSELR